LAVQEIRPEAEDWRENQNLTRAMGDAWLTERKTALAKVPSAVAQLAWNFLLNPAHEAVAQVRVGSVSQQRFDGRLFKFGVGHLYGWSGRGIDRAIRGNLARDIEIGQTV